MIVIGVMPYKLPLVYKVLVSTLRKFIVTFRKGIEPFVQLLSSVQTTQIVYHPFEEVQ